MTTAYWNDLLLAWFHDPPDKALDIQGHKKRAAEYASAALAPCIVTVDELHRKGHTEDQLATIAERLPLPAGNLLSVEHKDGLIAIHPLSGDKEPLSGIDLNREGIIRAIREIADSFDDPRTRFFALWRLLPEQLIALDRRYARLPADTRVPDHTIWQHLDTVAGLYPAFAADPHGAAFLSFFIGPVHPFIEAARSVRDLWSGSTILSWLTFQAMLPLIEELGPTALVYPSLRGTPLLDLWLHREMKIKTVGEQKAKSARLSPCIPNRFLAVVPYGEDGKKARELATRCEQATREGWKSLADTVRGKLAEKLGEWPKTWLKRWNKQIESFFEIRTTVLPWRESAEEAIAKLFGNESFEKTFPTIAQVRKLADAIPEQHRPGYAQKSAGLWQSRVRLSAQLMETQRAIRHVPPYIYVRPDRVTDGHVHMFAPKCTLMGSYEQIGPEKLSESKKFWERAAELADIDGVRLRKGERFCAIMLAKRFAPLFFLQEFDLNISDLRLDDTATVAARNWLRDANLNPDNFRHWNGNWLHWSKRETDDPDVDPPPPEIWETIKKARDDMKKKGKGLPPAYYAILSMDADHIGKWLSGGKSPQVRHILHPKVVEYFEKLGAQTKEGLNARRPVGPALHAAISEALTNFAVHIVPPIVEKHNGTLIYAGGDDVLALLPARSAPGCARELRLAFSGDREVNNGSKEGYYRVHGRDLLVMGPEATLSAGIAVVHYKEDLRFALHAARSAEEAAKRSGRNACVLKIYRRSGKHSSVLCSWNMVQQVEKWMNAFENGASDRWTYRIQAEMPALSGLPLEAMKAELKRQVNRAERKTRELFGETGNKSAGQLLCDLFEEYLENRKAQTEKTAGNRPTFSDPVRPPGPGDFFMDFIVLVQSASFLAERRDAQ